MSNLMQLIEDPSLEFMTRTHGEKVRKKILESLRSVGDGSLLTIDFHGVDAMTPSFADECFGKLIAELGREQFKNRVRLIGAIESIRVLINAVMSRRLEQIRK